MMVTNQAYLFCIFIIVEGGLYEKNISKEPA